MDLREQAKELAKKYKLSDDANVTYHWSRDRYIIQEGNRELQVDPLCTVFINRKERHE